MALESDRIDRRAFLGGAAALLLWPALGRAAHHEKAGPALPAELRAALEKSPYVYVSPLRSSGAESTCHGEVWFGWIDGAVVLNTSPSTWKARALEKDLARARIWVGDHGRWKRLIGPNNEDFRQAPHFEARASRVTDRAVNERLLRIFDEKYPAEIGAWREKMSKGFDTGERLVIRYEPVEVAG